MFDIWGRLSGRLHQANKQGPTKLNLIHYEDPPFLTAEQAIDIALDRLVPPLNEEFLRDWRDRKDLKPWLGMIAEVEMEFTT